MTYATVISPTPAVQSTCETCSKFKDYQDRGRGECLIFDKVTRKHHEITQDCRTAIESEQLQLLLDNYNAFLKPIAKGLPGIKVFKQSPDYGYDRIGYVGQNMVGWFAHDKNGLTVAESLPSKVNALTILLNR